MVRRHRRRAIAIAESVLPKTGASGCPDVRQESVPRGLSARASRHPEPAPSCAEPVQPTDPPQLDRRWGRCRRCVSDAESASCARTSPGSSTMVTRARRDLYAAQRGHDTELLGGLRTITSPWESAIWRSLRFSADLVSRERFGDRVLVRGDRAALRPRRSERRRSDRRLGANSGAKAVTPKPHSGRLSQANASARVIWSL